MEEDPYLPQENEKTVNFTIRLGVREYTQLRDISSFNHTTISALIRKAIRDLLTDYTGEPTLSQVMKEVNQLRSELAVLEAKFSKEEEVRKENV